MLSRRVLSLYQKAVITNTLVLSKLWYLAHVFELRPKWARSINATVFKYVWGGVYQPIKRETLYLDKLRGGIGIINIEHKAKAILLNTFLHSISRKIFGLELLLYYCKIRASYLIQAKECESVSFVATPYYNVIIDELRMIIKSEKYPNVNVKIICQYKCSFLSARIEEKYPLFNWENIWRNLANKFIEPCQRGFLYRYIH